MTMRKKRIDFNLYLITDRTLVSQHGMTEHAVIQLLVKAVRQSLKGGVRAVQIREKTIGTRMLLDLAYTLRDLTSIYEARLFINDRVDIALAAGADGVHLTRNSIPAAAARRSVGSKLLIGVSTHSLKEARDAQNEGADFLTFGPVYPTRSKLRYGTPVGTTTLKRVCSKINIPVFALGGINASKIDEVLNAGAYGVSMISGILGVNNVRERSQIIMHKLASYADI